MEDLAAACRRASSRRCSAARAGPIRRSTPAHVLGVALLVGAVVPMDLRLIGVWRGDVPTRGGAARCCGRSPPSGPALAVVTGVLLFTVQATDYVDAAALLREDGARRRRPRPCARDGRLASRVPPRGSGSPGAISLGGLAERARLRADARLRLDPALFRIEPAPPTLTCARLRSADVPPAAPDSLQCRPMRPPARVLRGPLRCVDRVSGRRMVQQRVPRRPEGQAPARSPRRRCGRRRRGRAGASAR